MNGNPCDTCSEDCLGGIIYGNCRRFRSWCKDNIPVEGCFNSRLYPEQVVMSYPEE